MTVFFVQPWVPLLSVTIDGRRANQWGPSWTREPGGTLQCQHSSSKHALSPSSPSPSSSSPSSSYRWSWSWQLLTCREPLQGGWGLCHLCWTLQVLPRCSRSLLDWIHQRWWCHHGNSHQYHHLKHSTSTISRSTPKNAEHLSSNSDNHDYHHHHQIITVIILVITHLHTQEDLCETRCVPRSESSTLRAGENQGCSQTWNAKHEKRRKGDFQQEEVTYRQTPSTPELELLSHSLEPRWAGRNPALKMDKVRLEQSAKHNENKDHHKNHHHHYLCTRAELPTRVPCDTL